MDNGPGSIHSYVIWEPIVPDDLFMGRAKWEWSHPKWSEEVGVCVHYPGAPDVFEPGST